MLDFKTFNEELEKLKNQLTDLSSKEIDVEYISGATNIVLYYDVYDNMEDASEDVFRSVQFYDKPDIDEKELYNALMDINEAVSLENLIAALKKTELFDKLSIKIYLTDYNPEVAERVIYVSKDKETGDIKAKTEDKEKNAVSYKGIEGIPEYLKVTMVDRFLFVNNKYQ